MANCVRNIYTKHYQNLTIGFQVTVINVGDVFLRQSVHNVFVVCGLLAQFVFSHTTCAVYRV